ncbi:MAG: undecaprenyl-diphosphate phosphatase [Bdellovibrionales bacterium]|nr:undecaprenyl-diphosphate phosphatase [Bdellovibrionales bacterium]
MRSPAAQSGGTMQGMSLWEALLYGLVQGLTEYLPVSSSAHLILLPHFLGTADPGLAFDVFLHLGTLAATLIYFRRDWLAIAATAPVLGPRLKAWAPRRSDAPNWKLIVLATLPALAAGALLSGFARTVFRDTSVLVWTLPLGGILLVAADRFLPQKRVMGTVGWRDALGVGVAQCFALVPGMSRSGCTITGARLLGLDRHAAARFSFLISAPVVLAATVYEARHWQELVHGGVGWGALAAGCLGAFASGWLAIDLLLGVLKRFGYLGFAMYRAALAGLIYAVLLR